MQAEKPITTKAVQFGISAGALCSWLRQDQIDPGERPRITTPETAKLARAKKQMRQLEIEVKILNIAAKQLGEDRPGLKEFDRSSVPASVRLL